MAALWIQGDIVLKKFRDGFVFGLGFSLACVLVAYIAISSNELTVIDSSPSAIENPNMPIYESYHRQEDAFNKFHELPVDEQIEMASAIAIAKYEKAPDGKMKAIIKEFLKKNEGTTIYYDIGDEYEASSFYPEEKVRYGEGVIIFFTGSPASMRMSMTFSGDRIGGLGDMPLVLLREKCRSPNA